MATLTEENIRHIEAKAKEVLQMAFGDINLIDAPIELTKVLNKLNISLEEIEFADDTISGAFDRAKRKIFISRNETYPRQKFTIAHEIAHFLLHDQDREVYFRKQVTQPEDDSGQEAEANTFAAALLMPENMLKKQLAMTKNMDALVKVFGVSYAAMYYRLKNLGLLNETNV